MICFTSKTGGIHAQDGKPRRAADHPVALALSVPAGHRMRMSNQIDSLAPQGEAKAP